MAELLQLPTPCRADFNTKWQYQLWTFQARDTKLKSFLSKNHHAQRKLLNFWNWCSAVGRCQKVPKFDFQSQFSMSKIIGIFLNFFFIEEYELRSTFVVIVIF